MTNDLSPKELKRRLHSLEISLEKSKERSKTLTSERDSLKRRLATAERNLDRLRTSETKALESLKAVEISANERVSSAEKKTRAAEDEKQIMSKQVSALIEENRRLAERLETTIADLSEFRGVALGAEDLTQKAREETETRMQAEFAEIEEKFRIDQNRLNSQITGLERQIREQGKILHMPPERVADLVNSLVNQLRSGMPGLKLKDGEIRLKVGLAGIDEYSGFVVPTPDSGPEVKDSLHEVIFRFDQVSRISSKSDR